MIGFGVSVRKDLDFSKAHKSRTSAFVSDVRQFCFCGGSVFSNYAVSPVNNIFADSVKAS